MHILLKDLALTLVRYAIVAIATWFVSKGILTQDQVAAWTSPDVVFAVTGGVTAVLIGLWKTYRSRLKFLAALDAPKGTTEQEIKDALKVHPPALVFVPFAVGALLIPLYAMAYSGCATSTRARVVQGYQATQIGLGAVQDAEIALYKAGTLPALDLDRHQAISRVFVQAFEAQIVFGNALLVWRSGAPPAGYDAWLKAIDDTLVALDALLPADRALLTSTVAWTRNVVQVIRALGLVVPPKIATLAATP